MRKKQYEVIIVGCGPGGAVAGKFAALNGAETLIIEEKRQIGFPVYDSMGIIYSKSEMEEATGEEIEPATIYSRAEGLAYISPSGKEGKPQLLPDGIFVNRQLFEKSLAIGAVRAGAEIMLHTRAVDVVREEGIIKGVIIRNDSELMTIPCSVVIAADGAYQHIARLAGIETPSRNVGMAIGCEFAGVKSLGGLQNIDQIYMDGTGQRMYQYVVPYAHDRFSVGNSCSPTFAKEKKSLKQRLDDLIRHLQEIGRYDFSKASPVSMMSGGQASPGELAVTPRLASDGIILVGNAAGAPLYGSRWGGVAVMLGACWTGHVAGEIAARAVRKGDVSERSLNGEYRSIIDQCLKKEERTRVLESSRARREILALSAEEQDRAVEEIGWEVAALHFHSKGGLASPLPSCLEPAQKWLKERGRG